jgi:hypothetical protein
MKKVNLKGKLNLKKETLSKLDMTNVSGGATVTCQTINLMVTCGMNTLKCASLVCTFPHHTCGIQTLQTCAFICPTGPTTGPNTQVC